MAAADQSISLMDGTYFVGRKEILDWVNGLCGTHLTKVEQTCTGAVACQILDAMYPGKVPMSRVDWAANKDYEYIQNYKVLQKCFTGLKIDKHIEVDRLVRGKYQDNLEFMQWFKKFYELNASGQPYDPLAQREKGKGGAQFNSKFGGTAAPTASSSSSSSSSMRRKSGTATSTAASRTSRTPPGAPTAVRGAKTATGATRRPVGSAGSASAASSGGISAEAAAADKEAAVAAATAQYEKELEELAASNAALTDESGELRSMVESLEKERDFYFNKLREIEIMLQGVEDAETNPLAQAIFKVLYATEDDVVEEQEAGEPQDEQM